MSIKDTTPEDLARLVVEERDALLTAVALFKLNADWFGEVDQNYIQAGISEENSITVRDILLAAMRLVYEEEEGVEEAALAQADMSLIYLRLRDRLIRAARDRTHPVDVEE